MAWALPNSASAPIQAVGRSFGSGACGDPEHFGRGGLIANRQVRASPSSPPPVVTPPKRRRLCAITTTTVRPMNSAISAAKDHDQREDQWRTPVYWLAPQHARMMTN